MSQIIITCLTSIYECQPEAAFLESLLVAFGMQVLCLFIVFDLLFMHLSYHNLAVLFSLLNNLILSKCHD